MEALSPTMEEGRLVEWKKKEGEKVSTGDVLADVETDKAIMELVARADGVLLKQVVREGSTVPVSSLVAVIGQPGEDVSALVNGAGGAPAPAAPKAAAAAPAKPVEAPTEKPKEAAQAAAPAPAPAPAPAAPPPPPAAAPGGRVKASPLARKIAAERGLDLAQVSGSGPEGRVVRRDLEGVTPRPAAAAAPTGAPVSPLPMFR
jgi:pyruvate dehydrogenase E2 component (dihydrolipoamide acetyltransferase)